MPRDEWLAALPQLETRSLEPEIVNARWFGDVTVARVLVRWDASMEDRDLSGTYAVTDVFRREAGGLRLAWRISVRLPDE
jgi:transposase InsO family protein